MMTEDDDYVLQGNRPAPIAGDTEAASEGEAGDKGTTAVAGSSQAKAHSMSSRGPLPAMAKPS